ncbi:MAG: methyltransferase domain-containing protein [Chloroflexi bacterium]|nr:methyltransferase domain-containing protein [Chloroflexota bacterium]
MLTDALEDVTPPDHVPAVLDCGGGSGRFAVPLAEAGAHVTVVDISADALATLVRRAEESSVADRILPVQDDVETFSGQQGSSRFDLVLAHEILEVIDDPAALLASMAGAVRTGGLVSILVVNPAALVLSRILAGDVRSARDTLRRDAEGPAQSLNLASLARLCVQHGLFIEHANGIGVFAELLPESDLGPDTPDLLEELDGLASSRTPYRDIAGRLHVLARRPVD